MNIIVIIVCILSIIYSCSIGLDKILIDIWNMILGTSMFQQTVLLCLGLLFFISILVLIFLIIKGGKKQ
jgi:hypothetical protein